MAAVAFGFAACSDQDDVVDALIDEVKERPVVKSFPYTLTTADYASISAAALKDAGDNSANAALANAVKNTNSLNSFADPLKYIPGVLGPKYPGLGLESAVQVTYAYTPDYLAGLTASPPSGDVIVGEDFTAYATGAAIDQNGWSTVITKGTKNWSVATYGGNNYAYINVFSGAQEESESYLISPQIDLSKTTQNHFSFDITTGYVNVQCLSVLISSDENAATDPAAATWTDVTSSFTIPMQSNNWPPFIKSGTLGLDADFGGKKIYIAFRFSGGNAVGKTTGYEIDNISIFSGKVIEPKPGEVFINDPEEGWIVLENGIALTDSDFAAMGVTSLTTDTAPNYLPVFFAQKFPYAQQGDRKAVLFGANAAEYVYTGGRWSPTIVGAPLTEQYVNDGEKWIFDPTVKLTMAPDDYQIMVDWVKDNIDAAYLDSYGTAEYYYGFASFYRNVSFRFSYRSSYPQDTEFHALAGNAAAQLALLWKRLEQEGMPKFLQLKYPLSPAIAQGVQLYYDITVAVHSPDDGTTIVTKDYMMRYKVLTAGSAGTPPTFEFVSTTAL